MPYLAQWTTAADADFRRRVTIAAVDVCRDVAGEATGTANHANRVILMRSILADPNPWGDRMAYAVAMLGGDAASTDAQLKTHVANVFNAYSGVA